MRLGSHRPPSSLVQIFSHFNIGLLLPNVLCQIYWSINLASIWFFNVAANHKKSRQAILLWGSWLLILFPKVCLDSKFPLILFSNVTQNFLPYTIFQCRSWIKDSSHSIFQRCFWLKISSHTIFQWGSWLLKLFLQQFISTQGAMAWGWYRDWMWDGNHGNIIFKLNFVQLAIWW